MSKIEKLIKDFYESKIYKEIPRSNIFALKFANGKIGYVSIVGHDNDLIAFNLYLDIEKIKKLLLVTSSTDFYSPFNYNLKREQEFVQVNYDSEYDIPEHILKNLEIKIKVNETQDIIGWVIEYTAGNYPSTTISSETQHYLEEALEIFLRFTKEYNKGRIANLKFLEFFYTNLEDPAFTLPLLSIEDGALVLDITSIDNLKDLHYFKPEYNNQVQIEKFNRVKPRGIYEATIIYNTTAISENIMEETAYFPEVLLVTSKNEDSVFPPEVVKKFDQSEFDIAINKLVNRWISQKQHPKKLLVNNKKAFDFFEDFCKKTNIILELDENAEEINNLVSDFITNFAPQDESDYITEFEDMEEDEFLDFLKDNIENKEYEYTRNVDGLPEELRDILENMNDNELLDLLDSMEDDELSDWLDNMEDDELFVLFDKLEDMDLNESIHIPQFMDKIPEDNEVINNFYDNVVKPQLPELQFSYIENTDDLEEKTYLLRINSDKGYEGKIKISSKSTLFDLELALNLFFHFNKSCFASFFIGDKIEPGYEIVGAMSKSNMFDEMFNKNKTNRYILEGFNLDKGDQLVYIFDYENPEQFHIELEDILDEKINYPIAVEIKE